MSLVTEEIKANAEVYYGDEICQEKTKLLLKEVGLPNGLLPLKDIEECGYVKETGFVWLKQKKKIDQKFEKIGKLVSYATEVTAYAEPNKIKKLTGVKAKELLVWMTLSEIYVDDPPTGKITFKTPSGLSKSFPVSAFEIEEAKDVKEVNNGVVNNNGSVKEVKEINNEVMNNNGSVKEVKEV
uniref:Plant/F25P12-18 protein n=1 Tax=Davidia involucrata TaxID=16924 RepID=A0A5B7AFQ0_DAVIN